MTSPDAQARLKAFAIGDEVAVLPDAGDWASDWQDVQLWIAGVHAVAGGGFEYWVSDIWPLPGKPALTDGFYMDVEGESNTLSLVSRTPDAQPSSTEGEVERMIEALTPSAATKAAYIGEFSFTIAEGKYGSRIIPVPWTTIKEIMAAIRARAAIAAQVTKP